MEMLGFSSFLILLNWPASFPAVHFQFSCETNLVGSNTFIIVITREYASQLSWQRVYGSFWLYRRRFAEPSGLTAKRRLFSQTTRFYDLLKRFNVIQRKTDTEHC